MADKSSYVQELVRRSNDLLRIYNPTNKDHVVEWDRKEGVKLFRVLAKTEEVLVRYIADKYLREMFDKIITEKADKAVLAENKKRSDRGMEEMSTWKEQLKFESKLYNPDSVESQKLLAILYLGVDREYGIDRQAEAVPEEASDKPVFEQALETVQKAKDASLLESDQPPEEAEKPELKATGKEFKCIYPDCGFETDTKIALFGHKRSHRDPKEEAIKGVSK